MLCSGDKRQTIKTLDIEEKLNGKIRSTPAELTFSSTKMYFIGERSAAKGKTKKKKKTEEENLLHFIYELHTT